MCRSSPLSKTSPLSAAVAVGCARTPCASGRYTEREEQSDADEGAPEGPAAAARAGRSLRWQSHRPQPENSGACPPPRADFAYSKYPAHATAHESIIASTAIPPHGALAGRRMRRVGGQKSHRFLRRCAMTWRRKRPSTSTR